MRWMTLILSPLMMFAATGCGEPEGGVLKIFHAGSLSVPFQELEGMYEAQHPGVDVQRESYGSATAIRQVTELGRPADVVGSADYRLIDQLMVDAEPSHADWNVLFARNAIILAYTDPDDPITTENWAEVLADPDVRVGMSSPNQDPCGYRSLYTVHLADTALGADGLFQRLVLDNSNVTVEESDGGHVINVPSDVRYTGRLTMRPKETDLLALLEAGAIDYLFIYRSVAAQHDLPFVELPEEVNLSSPALADDYGQVSVRQYADQPDKATLVQASPIVYGVTVPSEAPNRVAGEAFVELLLSDAGREVLSRNGQAPLDPPVLSRSSSKEAAPFDLQLLD